MDFLAIERMLQMANGGTVSGRGPVEMKSAMFDALSGDDAQNALAKQNLFEAMRRADHSPGVAGSSLTEAELTELSTGQVDGVLSHIRAKLIKRGKPGRAGSMKNIADYAKKQIMSLGESNLKPGDMNQGNYAEQKPEVSKHNKTGYSTGEFTFKEGGATKQAAEMKPVGHRGVKPGDPIGETTETDDERDARYKRDSDASRKAYMADPSNPTKIKQYAYSPGVKPPELRAKLSREFNAAIAARKKATESANFCHVTGLPAPCGCNACARSFGENTQEESAMSDADNKKGAAAAGERKFDTVWDDVESEGKRIAGVASKTGLKAPLKEAIAAFQETTGLSDALSEYNTASGKVSGQKVYTDPVATMNINSAYRTELLKLNSGKSAMAGKPGSVKSRGIKPGDPIGD